ncbi:COMM domain-containing protein 10 [Eufriesea mexicana]|uniref:COMM domain-containing protein 10 n=1 Tax=Eufriesea mexicana TaxID=516756 RepID=A0A310SRY5_9HYME|nr:PREDICTED: COMM domain-containing protein 10 [Eufriesea mexicana]OAD59305.1 COMM domain-containing protein 10 [Eufriesea mexicana]
MASWITVTPRLEQGLKIANQIDSSKFRLLISRICQTLQSNVNTKIFNEEEEEKLLISLDLNKDDLVCLLDAVILIYKQAACNIIKPQLMESSLKDTFKTDDDKVQIFINAWVTYGKGIIDHFRQMSIFPIQVKDINWCLNIQAASSTIKKDVRPMALLQLNLTGEEESKVTVEFNKNELIDLYQNLEKIQSQLDAFK